MPETILNLLSQIRPLQRILRDDPLSADASRSHRVPIVRHVPLFLLASIHGAGRRVE
jgi:hypothetical protein